MSNAIIGFFPNLGMWEIVIILFFALLLFGGKKLPELARGLGKGLRQFKEEVHGVKEDLNDAMNSEDDEISSDVAESDTVEDTDESISSDVAAADSGDEKADGMS